MLSIQTKLVCSVHEFVNMQIHIYQNIDQLNWLVLVLVLWNISDGNFFPAMITKLFSTDCISILSYTT